MELLQNRRYKPYEMDRIPTGYYREIETQIESIIEVCREGEISSYEALNIIDDEAACSLDYRNILREIVIMLYTPEDDKNLEISFCKIYERLKNMKDDTLFRDYVRKGYEYALERIEDYFSFISEAHCTLIEINESADYKEKRKAKIKLQIIRDGITLPLEKVDSVQVQTQVQTPKINIVDCHINYLVVHFPEFANDYCLLLEKGFLVKSEKGLRRGYGLGHQTSKKFLTDYFKSVNPPGKKDVPWTIIQILFDEKDLKNSASINGNEYREPSEDFIEWLEIKKTLAAK